MRYWSGFATGVCALCLFSFAVTNLYFIPSQVATYSEFKGAILPPLTLLVLSPAWQLVVPTLALAAVLALNSMKIEAERRRSIALAIAAGVLLFTLTFSHWALFLPMFELAENVG